MYYKINRILIIFVMLFVFLTACDDTKGISELSVSDWVESHAGDEYKVICEKTVGDNSYFVSLNAGTAKTGYLLYVGDAIDKPYTYIFSWGFQDEKGDYVIKSQPSVNLSKQYVTLNNKLYSESIDTTELNLENANKLVITVITKTYTDKNDVPENLEDVVINDKSAKFKLCEVDLNN